MKSGVSAGSESAVAPELKEISKNIRGISHPGVKLGSMEAPDVGLPKIADVAHFNYCSSCGTCESICPVNAPVVRRDTVDVTGDKKNYRKIEIKTENLFKGVDPFKNEVNPCVACYACERVCPILDGFPIDEFNNIRSMKVGKSTKLRGQDGAIVSHMLKYLLETGDIDCALVVVRNDRWETEVMTITRPEDVAKASGTKYTYQPVVSSVRDIHRAFVDTYIDTLKKYRKVALVGVPCQVHGAHLFRENFNRIELIIGLLCMESFSEEIMFSEMIPNIMGLDIRDVVKMNFHKGKFIAETRKETKEVPIKEVAAMARKGCGFCMDYTSYYADISVGSVGSADGWSTIFIRTEKGETYLNKVKDIEYSDKPINMELVQKLTDQKHKHNKWDWPKFLREIWNRQSPPRPWGRERLERLPPPEMAALLSE